MRAFFALGGTASGGNNTAGLYPRRDLDAFVARNVVRLAVATTRWRHRLRNADVCQGTVYPGAISVTGGLLGAHAITDDAWTGRFEPAPAPVAWRGSDQTPADGSELVSPWVEDPELQFRPHEDRLISVGFSGAAGRWVAEASNACYLIRGASDAASDAEPARSAQPFACSIEFETDDAAPLMVVLGDSISEGSGSEDGQLSNWGQLWAKAAGGVCVNAGAGGSKAADYGDASAWKYRRFDGEDGSPLVADAVVIAHGTNDLGVGGSSVQAISERVKGALRAEIRAARQAFASPGGGPPPVYLARTPPRDDGKRGGWDATREAARVHVNNWMAKTPEGVRGVLFFDHALRSPGNPSMLATEFRGAGNDVLHPDAAGQARMANEALAVVGNQIGRP